MPELDWVFGYPMALGLMIGMGVALLDVQTQQVDLAAADRACTRLWRSRP